jgi:hypothetical protein
MSREEIEKQMSVLDEKYKKLYKIAVKLAGEMDDTVNEFHKLEEMLKDGEQ